MQSLNISIKGVVQGVGFRPFVHKLAGEMSVTGYVTNTSDGVEITAEGMGLDIFIERLRKEAPPLSKIMSIDIAPAEFAGYSDFSIRSSKKDGAFTLVSADTSVCDDCLREMFDGNDRRYLYPFINCTNCGPRYSITRSVPYDRVNTTMNVFRMCGPCRAEYSDPSNRRFHAQPNACPVCGPSVKLIVRGSETASHDPVGYTVSLLKEGAIVAVKGLGGFHLACDALNNGAVIKLRERKRRSNKPFALMVPDIEAIKIFCHVKPEEEDLLLSSKRPVVLLRKLPGCSIPDAVSPNNSYLGFMLPYTPLHYLLFHQHGNGPGKHRNFEALVMTSGNVSEEPIVIDNDEAVSKLSSFADAFLLHDRDIFMRVDDSVVKFAESYSPDPAGLPGFISSDRKTETVHDAQKKQMSFIRRSRGYAPDPIQLYEEGPEVLGCGADLKNTFTLTKGRYAIPSQHIGDMENYETLLFFEETLRNIKKVYRATPVAIAHDLHPGYLSTQWAVRQEGAEKYAVQHHYAHIASVMAERGIKEKVLGVAFDGTGYGTDGTLWGGEFLVADLTGFRRVGHIEYVPLPGGETAIREPWRTAVSYVAQAAGREVLQYLRPTGFIDKYGKEQIDNILRIMDQPAFSPLSSGAGRLFDAVAALIGVCDRNSFEGEAAIALESIISSDIEDDYPVDISFRDPMGLDFSAAMLGILNDLGNGAERGTISAKFHNTVISAVVRMALKLALTNNLKKVILSGGVFQNSRLAEKITIYLRSEGLEVYSNEIVPCNDGGISLGQAYIIRERIRAGR